MPGIRFIGATTVQIEARESVEPATLESLAAGATRLLIEAFDAEGLVVCDLPPRR